MLFLFKKPHSFSLLIMTWNIFSFTHCTTIEKKPETNPKTQAKFLVQLGNSALLDQDPTGALKHLLNAKRLNENSPELHHSLALAYYAKKDLKSAHAHAFKAVELAEHAAEVNNTYGKILMDTGKADKAVFYLTKAAKNPTYREAFKAWTNLGIIAFRQNKTKDAQIALDRAIEEAPENACIAYYYRGHTYIRQSKFQEAIGDYAQATKKLCAKFSDARLALGIAYQKSGQYDLARRTLLEVQKLYPNTRVASQAIETLKSIP